LDFQFGGGPLQQGSTDNSPTKLRLNPIFRWAGSKRKQLPALETHWNAQYRRYVEPFAGSAALFFHLQPERALLGDINGGLIESYDVIRSRPDDIYHAVVALPRGETDYYVERNKDPRKLSKFHRAVRFIYLNRHCFNGIFRTNTDGKFNVPYAHARAGAIPSIEDFRRTAQLLDRASLKCADFGRILSSVRKGDFVFLDPPYAVTSRRVFRQYDKRAFTPRDLVRLSKHLERIDACGAKFVMTYADCREVTTHFKRWERRRIRVRRHIAGFADARRSAFEVLITNLDERS
jgi:DNA adenine methylase